MNNKIFTYYFARFIITIKPEGKLILDVTENFEELQDAADWIKSKKQGAKNLGFEGINKYYIEDTITKTEIKYQGKSNEQ